MIGIIGKKVGMTQIFNEDGQQVSVTVVEAEPNPVLMASDRAKTGMAQIQLGYGAQRVRRENAKGERTPRAAAREQGRHWTRRQGRASGAAASAAERAAGRRAGKNAELPSFAVGDSVNVGVFSPGDQVKVTGTTKGKRISRCRKAPQLRRWA